MDKSLSIITTCKGRLHHLKQTLPAMLAQGAEEVIVVDYDCPDGTGAWVEAHHPGARVVRASDPKGFCAARARNSGAAQATGTWLAFIDADNIPQPGWLDWLRERFSPRGFFVIEEDPGKLDSSGALVCSRREFLAAGRYDEAIRGWGAEDTDLVNRLTMLGLARRSFPTSLMDPIKHGDESRQTMPALSLQQVMLRNILYLRAKDMMNRHFGGMELCCREALLERASEVASNSPRPDKYVLHYPFKFSDFARLVPQGSAGTALSPFIGHVAFFVAARASRLCRRDRRVIKFWSACEAARDGGVDRPGLVIAPVVTQLRVEPPGFGTDQWERPLHPIASAKLHGWDGMQFRGGWGLPSSHKSVFRIYSS